MNTNIFICQLPKKIQSKIKEMVIEYLKKNDCYILENLDNILNDRLENLNQDDFKNQFNKILKEI
ncbi:TPA: hypothetical protein ACXDAY_002304 [Clostridium botulinum]|uniref:hypothetical protein n=1 Tax=Clostridium botulinum TaxID=1491 RepID=UPI0004650223|nr:hypothetical protein [Clostridium botulinum]APR02301.1 hypothetical protein RSJ2_4167 [Clostridium botulinum]AUN01408.1 hypothetical protein RSJ19_00055 [Clostridium botulinum]MBN3359386.1 hypothetical protein [Clostridium botulinum]MBN3367214.1 hypothetical protein [Clostridium botulinum]MBN3371598.1 hypothetical protein [Clostridium botulinum]